MTAARLGEIFGTSPLTILDSDEIDWTLWMACGKIINNDRLSQAEKNKPQSVWETNVR